MSTPEYYKKEKGSNKDSLYKFCMDYGLNIYEFEIIKRTIRCRKKGRWREDLEKTKVVIDLYLKEYEEKHNFE